MSTGLPPGKTAADSDWVVHFSNFTTAWGLVPPRPGGKPKGEDVAVVHPDTGYTEHPELVDGGRYLTDSSLAKNFYRPGSVARDNLRISFPSHGTTTASVMMSGEGPLTGNYPGYGATDVVTGVAPEATVIPCLVASSVMLNDRSDAALAKAIYHAISLNSATVGVISISLGRSTAGGIADGIRKALSAAVANGIVVCAAAGQATRLLAAVVEPTFPGSDPNTICVGACDSNHVFLDTGFDGPAIDITAPGVDVWVARALLNPTHPLLPPVYVVEGGGTGTSYATAVTAGACALWQAFHGRPWLLSTYGAPLIFKLFREVLKRSCHTPPGWSTAEHGAGILDAHALLLEPLPTKAQVLALP